MATWRPKLNDALLLGQRHAPLDQALRPLTLHRPLSRRNSLSGRRGCLLDTAGRRRRQLFAQHAVEAAAARSLNAERLKVVQTQHVAKIDQARATVSPRHVEVGRRHFGRHFGVRQRHGGGRFELTHGDELLMLGRFSRRQLVPVRPVSMPFSWRLDADDAGMIP